MNRSALRRLCAPALLCVVGCSSDITFTSGVDGTKRVSEVTAHEAQTLCDNALATARDFAEQAKEGLCALAGRSAVQVAFTTDPAGLCESVRAECLGKAAETRQIECNIARVNGCEATVGEVEACYNDALTASSSVLDAAASTSCADAFDPNTPTSRESFEIPASCTALAAKCPGLDVGVPSASTSG